MTKTLVIRGDLASNFGYAKLLRALLPMFKKHFEKIYGVDIHYHENFANNDFDHQLIKDEEIEEILDPECGNNLIFHHTTPGNYKRVPNAINAAYFVWETDQAPLESKWSTDFTTVDIIFYSSPHLVSLLDKYSFNGKKFYLPWPFDFSKKTSFIKDKKLNLYDLDSGKNLRLTCTDINAIYGGYYLSVCSDAPRKGISLLLSEWVEYVNHSNKEFCLILKLSTFTFSKSKKELIRQVLDLIKFKKSKNNFRILLLFENLDDSLMNTLYQKCRFCLSTSLGEGFGGTILETILNERPVLVPRHTSFEYLIPEYYKYVIKHRKTTVNFTENTPYSPSSMWGMIENGSLCAQLIELDKREFNSFENEISDLRKFTRSVCGYEKAQSLFDKYFGEIIDK